MAMATTRMTGSERRWRILDAAVRLFAARGYEATSVGEIAAAAGISKPVVYDHFESKRQLFVELMESIRDDLTARGAAAMSADAPLEGRVRQAVDAFFAYVEERPDAARVLLVVPRGEPELADATRRVQAEATGTLARVLLSEPRLLAGVRDRGNRVELMTEFMKQGIHGLAEWWSQNPGTPRRALVEATMDVVWSGLERQARPPG
jgi:AcrR family transcriptional regulator